MSSKKGMYLEQVVILNENGLPSLLREVADYVEQNNLELWDLLIDTQPDHDGSDLGARLIISGFVKLPNTACTRLETGAANADSESNPAVSSG